MKQIFISMLLHFICIFSMNPNKAVANDNLEKQSGNHLRILDLLPNLLFPLAVEPGVPENFVALTPSGVLDPSDWIYWGPKDVLEAFFKDIASLNVPILRVKLSSNVAQTGPNSFSSEEDLKMFEKNDPKGFACIRTQWGDYPIIAIRTRVEGKLIFTGWVGLNDPEAGWVLMFNLIYPKKEGHPNREDRQLWESLIMKTTQLKEGDYFKACGQDLQEGYTAVNVGGVKLKMYAEKRQSDGTIQVVVIPENSKIEFNYVDMMECAMGAKWKYGEPMVKVYGEFGFKDNNCETSINYVTSIFLKNVIDFSIKKDDEKNHLIFQKNFEQERLGKCSVSCSG